MTLIGRIVIVFVSLFCLLATSNSIPLNVVREQLPISLRNGGEPRLWKMRIVKPTIKHIDEASIKCLADNIYYEAGNQPFEGKLAVAFVTMNRLGNPDYPSSICGVVYEQRHPIYCQFSWVCERPARFEKQMWQESMFIARMVVEHFKWGSHGLIDPTHGALFFHATYVRPKWKTAFIQTVQIADHIFYRKE